LLTLTRLAALGTLSRSAGEGLESLQPPSTSPAVRERGIEPEGLGG
jgi:hypothetical protein